jgi:hypothetical protein
LVDAIDVVAVVPRLGEAQRRYLQRHVEVHTSPSVSVAVRPNRAGDSPTRSLRLTRSSAAAWVGTTATTRRRSTTRPPIDTRFHLKWWRTTGVQPCGAHVRRVTGKSEAPDSSQNTKTARRRRALARILGPVLGHPAGDGLFVALNRAAGGALQAIVQPVAQQLPHVAAMVGDPGQPLDHGRHARQGPVVGVEAVRASTLAQRLIDTV